MSKDIAICVQDVGKYYRLGQINTGMLYKDIQSWVARKRGKEDPHARIDEKLSDEEGFWALKDINLEIKKGDRVGIIGRNGAGKSTLLKILSQVTSPTIGWIGVNGRMASLLEVGTGFHPEMTGRENVYMNGAILGMKRAEINDKMKEIIEFSEIEQHIDTPVKRYSSGMYVRLAFAVAAHLDSEILIADEVLAVGDATFQKKALGKMNDLSSGEGRTVLFVSHQMNAVKSLCTSGIVLDHGGISMIGTTEECISFYQKELFSNDEQYDLNQFSTEFTDILEFNVVDNSGNVINESISNDLGARVKIRYNMKKLHSAFTIGYALYNEEGNLIYWTYDTDIAKNIGRPHLGENEIIGEIPAHFLNEGDYYVYLMESIYFQEWLINPSEKSPRIKISIRGGLSESPMWTLIRPGICAPLIKWKIVK